MINHNQPRTKILTRITVEAALTWKFYCSAAAQYDTAITCDIPAGNYYVADDHQDDDLIYVLCNAAIAACGVAGITSGPFFWIDEDHKINFQFIGTSFNDIGGDNDVKIAWTEEDGEEIGALLGFDTAADDESTADDYPTFTAGYQHAYGWYADEDGVHVDDEASDIPSAMASQNRSIAGNVKTIHKGDHYDNFLKLDWLSETKTWSGGVGYGETPVYPYTWNEALECWFHEAKKGTPFRVYRYNRRSVSLANGRGTATGGATTTIIDSGKSWDVDPQQWKGSIVRVLGSYYAAYADGYYSFYIDSHNATTLTVANAHPINHAFASSDNYWLYDMRYKTYVLKKEGPGFVLAPTKKDRLKYWMIQLDFLRYVS